MQQHHLLGYTCAGVRGAACSRAANLGVSCGSAGVHDGTEILRLGRIWWRWRLPAQIQERLPGVCFDARLLRCLHNPFSNWRLTSHITTGNSNKGFCPRVIVSLQVRRTLLATSQRDTFASHEAQGNIRPQSCFCCERSTFEQSGRMWGVFEIIDIEHIPHLLLNAVRRVCPSRPGF